MMHGQTTIKFTQETLGTGPGGSDSTQNGRKCFLSYKHRGML